MDLLSLIAVGFLAQLVDGLIGMGYGVTCSSLLLASGYPPLATSVAVHLSELCASGVSGYAHSRAGNVSWALLRRLLVPGVLGGAIGAYALSSGPSENFAPWVAAYLLLIGIRLVVKSIRIQLRSQPLAPRWITGLGFIGGFLDAVGGGGWGPIVTSTLISKGQEPRFAIGTANLAEFFVTLVQSITFAALVGTGNWTMAVALGLGGALAAPLAARTVGYFEPRRLALLVGACIVAMSLRTLWQTL